MKKEVKTALYAADTAALSDAGKYRELITLLSDGRKMKIENYKNEGDRLRSLAAGLLLRRAMEDNGIAPDGAVLKENGDGKPFLASCEGFCFNLSHSGSLAVCTVSSCAIGCDVQEMRDVQIKISRRFTERECAFIMAQAGEQAQREMLFRLWAMKESYVKAIGTGLKTSLETFSVDIENGGAIHTVSDGKDTNCRVREFELRGGYKCAVCTSAPDLGSARLKWIEL